MTHENGKNLFFTEVVVTTALALCIVGHSKRETKTTCYILAKSVHTAYVVAAFEYNTVYSQFFVSGLLRVACAYNAWLFLLLHVS